MQYARIILSVGIALACAIGYALFPDAILSFDTRVLLFFKELQAVFFVSIFGFFTMLGSWQGVLLAMVLIGMYARLRKLHLFYYYVLGGLVLGSGGVVYAFKHIVERARPLSMPAFFVETSFSFPSGHATIAVVLYGFLWYWFAREKILTQSLRILFFSLVLLISFSRIYLGVHYVSDVVGGLVLGSIILSLCAFFVDKRRWV